MHFFTQSLSATAPAQPALQRPIPPRPPGGIIPLRRATKRLAPELKQVADGRFDFSQHYHLLAEDESDEADED
jgi:hypothetical protein